MCEFSTMEEIKRQHAEITRWKTSKKCGDCDDFQEDDVWSTVAGFCKRDGLMKGKNSVCNWSD